ncbi:hypothetical protein ACFYW9_02480 [Streptomyces sp. NPDC002698]|uniref:hypothetical protein n=1 Tax=Streptomyces sp. NPDC002698 TaxID=3364660 RepID=UPI0036C364B6
MRSPDDIRLLRRIRAAAAERRLRDPQALAITPEERETEQRLSAGRPWFDGPIPLIPWPSSTPATSPSRAALPEPISSRSCGPCDHAEFAHSGTALRRRSSDTVTDILDAPPEPPVLQFDWYLPKPCLLAPEQVTEYPNPMELSKELQPRRAERAGVRPGRERSTGRRRGTDRGGHGAQGGRQTGTPLAERGRSPPSSSSSHDPAVGLRCSTW